MRFGPHSVLRFAQGVGIRTNAVRNLQVLKSIKEVWEYRDGLSKDATLGFVPTMGALHAGHIHLMHKSKRECNFTMSSIFVNPTQFSPGEDLDKYPRQLEADLKLLTQAQVDAVFVPSTADMYPPDTLCHVEPSRFSTIREGQARPEFFRGVATVVCKLFNITQPTHAFFGQKDISQCILLLHMVRDLNMRVNVIICDTLRESDGLAMSSRNAYLSDRERPLANVLYEALAAGQALFDKAASDGVEAVSADSIRQAVAKVLREQPLVSHVEYISIASHRDMQELEEVRAAEGAVLSSAVRLGKVRLIDNLLLGPAYKAIVK
eukprot:gene34774-42110_t